MMLPFIKLKAIFIKQRTLVPVLADCNKLEKLARPKPYKHSNGNKKTAVFRKIRRSGFAKA
jgi:hypothetical protein